MYSEILLATDGSEDARRAADHAFKLAETFGASLHVVYVAETAVPVAYGDYLRAEGDRVSDPRLKSWACQWTPLLPSN